jgi:hypothetical protein
MNYMKMEEGNYVRIQKVIIIGCKKNNINMLSWKRPLYIDIGICQRAGSGTVANLYKKSIFYWIKGKFVIWIK